LKFKERSMSFAAGFQAGYGVVSDARRRRDERERSQRQAEIEAQRASIESARAQRELAQFTQQQDLRKGLGAAAERYNVTERQGATQEQIDRGRAETAAMAQQDAAEFGLGAPQQFRVQDRQPAPTSFRVADQDFGTREAAEAAAPTMRTRGLADVYRQFGEVEKADELETRARQREAADLQLGALRRTEKQAEAFGVATQRIAEAQANGENITSDYLRSVASETGANFDALIDSAAKQLGFDDKQGTARIKKLQVSLAEASGKGVTGVNEFLASNFDPDKTDNITPKIIRDRQGNYVVQYGDRVLSEYGAHKSLDYLVDTVQGRINGDPLGTLQTLAEIELKKAQTQKTRAEAGAVGLGKTEKDITPQQQRAFDVLKGTEQFKTAVERGNGPLIRDMLVKNGLPPELFLGGTAAPPGGGTMDEGPEPAPAKPESANRTPTRTEPSPGALRALRERAIGRFTTGEVVDAAAAAGNPQAIQEQRRRAQERERVGQVTETQMRGLGG
jgi:hypothetical protein